MPDPKVESTEATPEDRKAADAICAVLKEARGTISALRGDLLNEARRHHPGKPVVVDGKPALINGDQLSLALWLRERIEGLCNEGAIDDALKALEYESSNPLSTLSLYVREHRDEIERHRRRRLAAVGQALDQLARRFYRHEPEAMRREVGGLLKKYTSV